MVKDMQIMHGVGQEARTFAPGEEIELTEREAMALGASVEPIIEAAHVDNTADEEDTPVDEKKRRKR